MDPSLLQALGLPGAAEDIIRSRRAVKNIPYKMKPVDDGSLASATALMDYHHDNEDDIAFEASALLSLARSIAASSTEDQYNITLILSIFYSSQEELIKSLARKDEAFIMWQTHGQDLMKVCEYGKESDNSLTSLFQRGCLAPHQALARLIEHDPQFAGPTVVPVKARQNPPRWGKLCSVLVPLGASIWVYSIGGYIAIWGLVVAASIYILLSGYAGTEEGFKADSNGAS